MLSDLHGMSATETEAGNPLLPYRMKYQIMQSRQDAVALSTNKHAESSFGSRKTSATAAHAGDRLGFTARLSLA